MSSSRSVSLVLSQLTRCIIRTAVGKCEEGIERPVPAHTPRCCFLGPKRPNIDRCLIYLFIYLFVCLFISFGFFCHLRVSFILF